MVLGMDIKTYLAKHDLSLREFGKLVGVNRQTVFVWSHGKTPVGAKSAVRIEQATEGVIQLHELRPDLWRPPPAEDTKAA